MCIVYMYQCRECGIIKRNYRRWPKFCTNTDCKRLSHPVNWCLNRPCESTHCTPLTCGIVEKVGLCPECALDKTSNPTLCQTNMHTETQTKKRRLRTQKQTMSPMLTTAFETTANEDKTSTAASNDNAPFSQNTTFLHHLNNADGHIINHQEQQPLSGS